MLLNWTTGTGNILLSTCRMWGIWLKGRNYNCTTVWLFCCHRTKYYGQQKSSTGHRTLGHRLASGWGWAGLGGCPQISTPGPSCWRWAASPPAPGALGTWEGWGPFRGVWMWFLWELSQSLRKEWRPWNLDQPLSCVLVCTLHDSLNCSVFSPVKGLVFRKLRPWVWWWHS